MHTCGAADAGASVLTYNMHALRLVHKQRNAYACVMVLNSLFLFSLHTKSIFVAS